MRSALLLAVALIGIVSLSMGLDYDPDMYHTRDVEGNIYRPEGCAKSIRTLPTASVIITAVDEKPRILETLVKSILYKTVPELLESIIIVDDNSQSLPVQESLKKYPGVQIVRSSTPLGVTRARTLGAAQAKGDVFIFLDSNMEVTERWLEPLLEYIQQHPSSVAVAVVDPIEEGGQYRSRVEASLVTLNRETYEFQWTSGTNVTAAPLETPLFLGSGFAVSKKWWTKSGGYDTAYQTWGMENIEMAVKTWTCGTNVVILPCSHIGRYFRVSRDETDNRYKNLPFLRQNAIRFAEVWMDNFKTEFYNHRQITETELAGIADSKEVADRKLLRTSLACKPFSWYADNVLQRIETRYAVKPVNYNPATLTLAAKAATIDAAARFAQAPHQQQREVVEQQPQQQQQVEEEEQQAVEKDGDDRNIITYLPPTTASPATTGTQQAPPYPPTTYPIKSFEMRFDYSKGTWGPNCPTLAWGAVPLLEVDPHDDYQSFSLLSPIKLMITVNLGPYAQTLTQADDIRTPGHEAQDDDRYHYPLVYVKRGEVVGVDWRVKGTSRRHVRFDIDYKRFDGRIPVPNSDYQVSHCVADLDFKWV